MVGLCVTDGVSASASRAEESGANASGSRTPDSLALGIQWRQISAGTYHTCGIQGDGALWCWGANTSGELGIGGPHHRQPTPQQVGTRTDWTFVTGGHNLTCAIPVDGTLWCWGRGDHGQVGDGGTAIVRQPVQIGSATTWASVDGSDGDSVYDFDSHVCGIRTDGSLWCWGQNTSGQLGIGTTEDALRPARVGHSRLWAQVSAGNDESCAVRTDGTLWCWGQTFRHGQGTSSTRPLRIGLSNGWTRVSVGGAHICAIRQPGTLWCWGANNQGQLGDGTVTAHLSPERIGSATDWVDVTAADLNTCGLRSDGTAWCWGYGERGQVGDGQHESRAVPTAVRGGPETWATAPSIRYLHACALGADSTAWCWGYNKDGELGQGDKDGRPLPAQVFTP